MRKLIVLIVGIFLLIAGSIVAQEDGDSEESPLTVVVGPSERGVVFDATSGDLLDPLEPGTHNPAPTQSVTLHFVGVQEYTMAGVPDETDTEPGIETRAIDGQTVFVDLTIIFQADAAQINMIHRNWTLRIVDQFVRPTMRSVTREAVAQFTSQDLISGAQAELAAVIGDELRARFEPEGLLLQDVLISNLRFSEAFTQAIERAAAAEERLRAAQIEAEVRIIEAETQARFLGIIGEQITANPLLIYYLLVTTTEGDINLTLPVDALP